VMPVSPKNFHVDHHEDYGVEIDLIPLCYKREEKKGMKDQQKLTRCVDRCSHSTRNGDRRNGPRHYRMGYICRYSTQTGGEPAAWLRICGLLASPFDSPPGRA
jgi:hypothetical protein